MGLCKCPKRKVTNLFCYEHRVNVCEYCMVQHHTKCVVQSYLHWLQDCDYNPICTLCEQKLESDECIRLVCYHVFHWRCLDHYALTFPPTTAPAGYTCPSCNESILPKSNVASPVADLLREKISTVNWARVGLGLPLVTEERNSDVEPLSLHHNNRNFTPKKTTVDKEDIVVHVEDPVFSRPEESAQMPRRSHGVGSGKLLLIDEDESKYRRKYSVNRVPMWLKSFGSNFKVLRPGRRSTLQLVVIIFFIFIGICMLLSHYGRLVTQDKPELDPQNNPNIRTG